MQFLVGRAHQFSLLSRAMFGLLNRAARLRALALLLAAAACWPGVARSDIYPAQDGRQIYQGGPIRADDVAACSAYGAGWSWGHEAECGTQAQAGAVCGAPYPVTRGSCFKSGFGCHVSCPAKYCPNGGTLSGSNCINASPCPAGQIRDPQTGACSTTWSAKNLGQPPCLLCKGNPVNAGTGTKFQSEPVYRSAGHSSLTEQLYYNSRLLSDISSVVSGAYGRGWRGHFSRALAFSSTGIVLAFRADGRTLQFQPPASGTAYISDADVADALQRLIDGAGNTTGWTLTVSADDSVEQFDTSGKLRSITDRAGNALTLAYSDASTPATVAPGPGFLISVSDPWGRALNYVRDSQGRITRTTCAGGW